MAITTPFAQREVYDPDTLTTLGTAFDTAWASIEHNFGPGSREAARLNLATIVFQLTSVDGCDLAELTCRAIDAMQVPGAVPA